VSETPKPALLAYLRMLAQDAAPGQFFDVRWRGAGPGSRMSRRALPAHEVGRTARSIERLANASDVYLGVALREDASHGGKHAIAGSRFVFIECDRVDCSERLSAFALPPSMEIVSGTPGHLHLYWQLAQLASSQEVERANRRLSALLGGDPGCVDVARVLRPPETLNHKHRPPAPVLLRTYREARYSLVALSARLPDDPSPTVLRAKAGSVPRVVRGELERQLRAIPSARYAYVLAGAKPNRAGKILCPFHAESDPSLQLYADGSFYCFGSGCRRGGSIFDFAGHLWGITPRGTGFTELRDRLSDRFDLERAACS